MQRLTNGGKWGTLSVGGGRKGALRERKGNGNENVYYFHNNLLIMQPICYQGSEEWRMEREDYIVVGGGKEGQ